MSLLDTIKKLTSKRRRRKAREETAFRTKFDAFKVLANEAGIAVEWKDRIPCAGDAGGTTLFDSQYMYHTNWAAKRVRSIAPAKHVDISSYTYFSTILSAFVPVDFYEYRPAPIRMDNLRCAHADLLHLPLADASVESLSCMHVIEHVGLGRYGEPVNPTGDTEAVRELIRVLRPGGDLLFVVPVGRPRICFNAHRLYSYEQVMRMFPGFSVVEFGLIRDDYKDNQGCLQNDGMIFGHPELVEQQEYGCGCWHFRKNA